MLSGPFSTRSTYTTTVLSLSSTSATLAARSFWTVPTNTKRACCKSVSLDLAGMGGTPFRKHATAGAGCQGAAGRGPRCATTDEVPGTYSVLVLRQQGG